MLMEAYRIKIHMVIVNQVFKNNTIDLNLKVEYIQHYRFLQNFMRTDAKVVSFKVQ